MGTEITLQRRSMTASLLFSSASAVIDCRYMIINPVATLLPVE
jgi:hypothetical protein